MSCGRIYTFKSEGYYLDYLIQNSKILTRNTFPCKESWLTSIQLTPDSKCGKNWCHCSRGRCFKLKEKWCSALFKQWLKVVCTKRCVKMFKKEIPLTLSYCSPAPADTPCSFQVLLGSISTSITIKEGLIKRRCLFQFLINLHLTFMK